MDVRDFLGLQPTRDPARWRLPVVPAVSSAIGALFGGCALAAAVEAMEAVGRRPLIWATAQFLGYAHPPAVVEVTVAEVVRGRHVSQARATLAADSQPIAEVVAALGERPEEVRHEWMAPPPVAPPHACPPRRLAARQRDTVMARIETRLARGRHLDELPGPPGDGHSALWVRVPDLELGAGLLAIVGDFVPFGISQATGRLLGGNSLDNTLRVVEVAGSTSWILVDVHVQAIARGHAHGLVHLWSEDGRLLGTAAQTAMVRRLELDPRPAPEGD